MKTDEEHPMTSPHRDLRSTLLLAIGWVVYTAGVLTDLVALTIAAGVLFVAATLTVVADIRARRRRPRFHGGHVAGHRTTVLPDPPPTVRREPPASVRQGAGALHGMYTALRESGFDHDDAMRLVADTLAAGQRGDT